MNIVNEIRGLTVDRANDDELKEPLPKSLEELRKRAVYWQIYPRDPQTGEPYTYTVKDEKTFELCTTFSLPRDSNVDVFWNHPAGHHCFSINVLDPPDNARYR